MAGPALLDVVDQAVEILHERDIFERISGRGPAEALLVLLLQFSLDLNQVREDIIVRSAGIIGRRIPVILSSRADEHLAVATKELLNSCIK